MASCFFPTRKINPFVATKKAAAERAAAEKAAEILNINNEAFELITNNISTSNFDIYVNTCVHFKTRLVNDSQVEDLQKKLVEWTLLNFNIPKKYIKFELKYLMFSNTPESLYMTIDITDSFNKLYKKITDACFEKIEVDFKNIEIFVETNDDDDINFLKNENIIKLFKKKLMEYCYTNFIIHDDSFKIEISFENEGKLNIYFSGFESTPAYIIEKKARAKALEIIKAEKIKWEIEEKKQKEEKERLQLEFINFQFESICKEIEKSMKQCQDSGHKIAYILKKCDENKQYTSREINEKTIEIVVAKVYEWILEKYLFKPDRIYKKFDKFESAHTNEYSYFPDKYYEIEFKITIISD